MDSDGFIQPKNTARPSNLLKYNVDINVSNKFNALSGNENMDVQGEQEVVEILPPKGKPIMIKPNIKFSDIVKQLKTDTKPDIVAKVNGEFLKIFAKSESDNRDIPRYLDEHTIDYYLIVSKTEKPVNVVFRGLPIDCLKDEIHEELEALEYKVKKVSQMHRVKSNVPMPLFQVQLENKPSVDKIYDLTYFMCFYVSVSAYNTFGSVVQCHNCQHFHHSAENCKLKPRCVKYAGPHKTENCKAKKIEYVLCCNFTDFEKNDSTDVDKIVLFLSFPMIRMKLIAKTVTPGVSYASTLKRRFPVSASKLDSNKDDNNVKNMKDTAKGTDPNAVMDIFKFLKELVDIFKGCSIALSTKLL
ncbi:uncharacterized protein LOC118204794 [Stegodyphus dumicola]|uniref:uncharacterized protein LOC118204794 n=1 Tax=Stegodyphus dumicola TaxID=202533 RepID=UPI0015B234D4|nr:uncharacterized protein LOC118204794 [Stegodyphus dumicola]